MKKTMFSMLLICSGATAFAQTTPVIDTANRPNTNTMTSPATDPNLRSANPNININSTNTNVSPVNSNVNANTNVEINSNTNTNLNTDATSNNASMNVYTTTAAVNVPVRFQNSFSSSYPAMTSAVWSQEGDFYKASYNTNGRYTHVYYGDNGTSYTLALPLLQSYVPDEVVSKAGSMYGPAVYSIGKIKTADGQDAYQVTLSEGGQTRMEWMREDGSMIQNVDVYRTEKVITSDAEMNSSGNADDAATADEKATTANQVTPTKISNEVNAAESKDTGSSNPNDPKERNTKTIKNDPAILPGSDKEKSTMKTRDDSKLRTRNEEELK